MRSDPCIGRIAGERRVIFQQGRASLMRDRKPYPPDDGKLYPDELALGAHTIESGERIRVEARRGDIELACPAIICGSGF